MTEAARAAGRRAGLRSLPRCRPLLRAWTGGYPERFGVTLRSAGLDDWRHSGFGIVSWPVDASLQPRLPIAPLPTCPSFSTTSSAFLPTRDRLLHSVPSGPTATASTEMHPTDAVARAPRHTGPVGAVKRRR